MKRIAIIDGNILINRAYYAMRNAMITKEGIFTQGVFGFINMLEKIRRDYEPEYMAIAFDMKAPTFRHREYQVFRLRIYQFFWYTWKVQEIRRKL